jgi:hypothetical protein
MGVLEEEVELGPSLGHESHRSDGMTMTLEKIEVGCFLWKQERRPWH